jgi:toxin-antitoxin system PIN domain toxin
VILVDVNLLVDATMTPADRHAVTRDWLADALAGSGAVALPWASLTGFLRVAGLRRAWQTPMPADVGMRVVRTWLGRPCTWIPAPGPRHVDLLDELLAVAPAARLVSDAHLAALAIEHGLELCSRDRDFARWADLGLRSRDPIG